MSGIVRPSALDLAGSTFPGPSPYGLRPPAFPPTSTPPSASLAPAPPPPLTHRRSSNIDRVLATAKRTLQEPLGGETPSAFDEFSKIKAEIDAANEAAKALEAVAKPKKRKVRLQLCSSCSSSSLTMQS